MRGERGGKDGKKRTWQVGCRGRSCVEVCVLMRVQGSTWSEHL